MKKSDSDILTDYIKDNYIDCIECDMHTRLLIANTLAFQFHLLKIRLKEFIDSLLGRR